MVLKLSFIYVQISTSKATILFSTVSCPSLTLDKGIVTCSLVTDKISYGDTCSFTCNTGYELIGSVLKTCQSDESWSGTGFRCRRGKKHVLCI